MNWGEVLALTYEFVITLVVMIGGGILLSRGIASEFITGLMGMVAAFWFAGGKITSAVNKALTAAGNTPVLPPNNTPPAPPLGKGDM